MRAEGEPGGVLIVGEYPVEYDDKNGRPFVGQGGRLLRYHLKAHWQGPIAIDNAIKCAPKGTKIEGKHLDACRPYLAQVLRDVQPQRVIALGSKAIGGLLGRSVPIMSVRRGYGWLWNDGDPLPVFFVVHPSSAQRNRFVKRWFEADLKWALTGEPRLPIQYDSHALMVTTAQDAEQAVAELRAAAWSAFDCETAGVMFSDFFRVVMLATAAKGSPHAWVWDDEALNDPARLAPLRKWLRDPDVIKVGHHLKYDSLSVRCDPRIDTAIQGYGPDSLLWRKMLSSDADGRLETMEELVGMGGHKRELRGALASARKTIQRERKNNTMRLPGFDPLLEEACKTSADPMSYAYAFIKPKVLARYNAGDALATARLVEAMEPAFDAQASLRTVWDLIVCKANESVEQMQAWGISCSREALEAYALFLRARQNEVELRLSNYNVDPASRDSIARLLYDDLGLKVPKETKTGKASTDKESLDALKGQHPVVDDIVEYRRISKLRSTYAESMLEHIRADGRIHPTIRLDGAGTGRTSCEDPNLQNIPRGDTAESKIARDVFAAPPGYVMLQLDYSQLELRIAAMLSNDPVMRQLFIDGVDFHMKTAELISQIAWGIPPSQVQKRHRSQAKMVNFGIIYRMSAMGLAARLGCDMREAEKILDAVLGKFRVFARWAEQQIALARRTGYVWTYWNGQRARRRPLWRVADKDDRARINAENAAVNTPVQGSASDYCLASLVEIVDWLREDDLDARCVLSIHDALLFEVHESCLHEVAHTARGLMTQWFSDGVPLEIDIEAGPAWGSLKKWDPDPAVVLAMRANGDDVYDFQMAA